MCRRGGTARHNFIKTQNIISALSRPSSRIRGGETIGSHRNVLDNNYSRLSRPYDGLIISDQFLGALAQVCHACVVGGEVIV